MIILLEEVLIETKESILKRVVLNIDANDL
jgi:hypothetical protein